MLKTKTKKILSNLSLDSWQRLEYKHTVLLLVSLFLFVLALDTALLTTTLGAIIGLGYLGAFIAGVFFPSLFTFAPASTVIVLLANSGLNPVVVALVAAGGAMIGDFLILRFVEEKVAYELKPIAIRFGIPQIISYLQDSRSTNWLVRLSGALFIASPLPDEVGIGLLGISKVGNTVFFTTCYALNALGILALAMLGKTVF
jgi:hypothetical protein